MAEYDSTNTCLKQVIYSFLAGFSQESRQCHRERSEAVSFEIQEIATPPEKRRRLAMT
jgi:hypothetical protein